MALPDQPVPYWPVHYTPPATSEGMYAAVPVGYVLTPAGDAALDRDLEFDNEAEAG
jgi:hypothetical protein